VEEAAPKAGTEEAITVAPFATFASVATVATAQARPIGVHAERWQGPPPAERGADVPLAASGLSESVQLGRKARRCWRGSACGARRWGGARLAYGAASRIGAAGASGLRADHNEWNHVEDFDWLKATHSPNWGELPEAERKAPEWE
jgi:hypothetical protein